MAVFPLPEVEETSPSPKTPSWGDWMGGHLRKLSGGVNWIGPNNDLGNQPILNSSITLLNLHWQTILDDFLPSRSTVKK
jgi:hypothetical protein